MPASTPTTIIIQWYYEWFYFIQKMKIVLIVVPCVCRDIWEVNMLLLRWLSWWICVCTDDKQDSLMKMVYVQSSIPVKWSERPLVWCITAASQWIVGRRQRVAYESDSVEPSHGARRRQWKSLFWECFDLLQHRRISLIPIWWWVSTTNYSQHKNSAIQPIGTDIYQCCFWLKPVSLNTPR